SQDRVPQAAEEQGLFFGDSPVGNLGEAKEKREKLGTIWLLQRRLLGKSCIFSQEKLAEYKRAFEAIFEIVDYDVTDGPTDLRLFAVLASLAPKNSSTEVSIPRHGTLMNFNSSSTKEFKGVMAVKNVSRHDHILRATSLREESSDYVNLLDSPDWMGHFCTRDNGVV
ncbi:hypothetical protein LEMLEM_LOCUS1874, partial [Lemmus lemmus]